MKRPLVLTAVISTSLWMSICSCSNYTIDNNNSRDVIYEKSSINVPNANSNEIKSAAEIFKSVDYIPLETTRESEFAEIDKMIVHKDDFLIYCSSANNVMVFNATTGKFKTKMKIPDNESVAIENFCFDFNQEIIILNNSTTLEFLFFDLDGNLMKKVSYGNLDFNNFDYFDNGFIFLMNYKYKEDETHTLSHIVQLTDFDLIEKKQFIDFNFDAIIKTDMYDQSNTFFRLQGGDTLHLSIPGDYYIYKFANGDLIEKMAIYPPKENQLPPHFLSDYKYKGKRLEYINNNKSKVFAIQDVYLTSTFKTFRLESFNHLMDTRLYYDNQYIDYLNVTYPFDLCYTLPIINWKINAAHNNTIYSNTDAKFMFEILTTTQLMNRLNEITNIPLKEFFVNGSVHNNPVVTKATFN